jgi:putative heme-binding domain-containing protein
VLRVKPDGSEVQLMAGGLRNPLDIAFNREGDLFTFDADMERDVGAPWYMPTRVLHVVPGADFGWRRGTGRYPSYYIDTLPSVVDIGLSSPTAIFFGYGAKFPAKYQDALFIFDWSYGRIIAVHLKPKGASYSGEQETFVSGRPLNVTDGCIGPDGAMWFTTGGRGTQSGLYRVASETADKAMPSSIALPKAVAGDGASDDPFARHAEMHMNLGVEQVREHVGGWQALTRWLAAVHADRTDLRDAALDALPLFDWQTAHEGQRLAVLRVLAIGLSRGGKAPSNLVQWLDAKWTGQSSTLSWELTKLLIYLKSPTIIARATDVLKTATTSEDLLLYPMHLRYLKDGWTLDQRRIVFEALNRAEKMNGASSYFKAIADTRAELAADLKPEEAKELASLIAPPQPVALSSHAMPAHSYKQWKLADLVPMLELAGKGRSFEKAKSALTMAQCVFCHRVSNDPTIPAGIVGPDLMQVSARFGRKDLLMHILEPSVFIDEKFKITTVTRVDGTVVSGALDHEDDERVVLKPNPLAPEVVEIAKAQIKTRVLSDVSPMPAGLLNVLKADQILDVLAWFEAGGDPKAKVWAK